MTTESHLPVSSCCLLLLFVVVVVVVVVVVYSLVIPNVLCGRKEVEESKGTKVGKVELLQIGCRLELMASLLCGGRFA